MKITIRSIAEAANVSRGTVDKVLNQRTGVSKAVREKVMKIADEMGYSPNLAGKALALQKKPIIIGVVILSGEDPLFIEVLEGVKKASHDIKGFGFDIKCCVMHNVTANDQIKCIQKLRKMDISALVVSPLDEEIIRTELNELTLHNIKIVTYNTDISGINRLCYVGQNAIKSGRVAGDLVGKMLPNGGNVILITGYEQIKGLEERVLGFEEVIASNYPNIRVINKVKNVDNDDTAYSNTIKLLKDNKDIDAIFITGRGISGVGRAIKELNRKHILFVCYDKAAETIQLIEDNIIDFSITQEPTIQGYLPIKILFEYFFHSKPPENEQLYTKLEIITKENLDN
ncbi:MAG: LacI family transcriptional regulator [Firmicutes bacterium HGW-Firmicutes-7]|nr:MAG: LacI family transcriptional regulator [Firmicutes bacterium HGW-Firmicutes-7]